MLADILFKTFLMISQIIIIALLAILVFGYNDEDDDDK